MVTVTNVLTGLVARRESLRCKLLYVFIPLGLPPPLQALLEVKPRKLDRINQDEVRGNLAREAIERLDCTTRNGEVTVDNIYIEGKYVDVVELSCVRE